MGNEQLIARTQMQVAEPMVTAKEVRDDGSLVEIAVWRLAQPRRSP
jgi:hypothetical protein